MVLIAEIHGNLCHSDNLEARFTSSFCAKAQRQIFFQRCSFHCISIKFNDVVCLRKSHLWVAYRGMCLMKCPCETFWYGSACRPVGQEYPDIIDVSSYRQRVWSDHAGVQYDQSHSCLFKSIWLLLASLKYYPTNLFFSFFFYLNQYPTSIFIAGFFVYVD